MNPKTGKYSAIEKIMEMDSESLWMLEISMDLIIGKGILLKQSNREIEEADAGKENRIFVGHEDAVKEIQTWRIQ